MVGSYQQVKTWEPTTYQGISLWGHTPVGQTVLDKLAQCKQAAKTVRNPRDHRPGAERRSPMILDKLEHPENAYDVAIIGYGPVGVTAANLLGGMGLKVAVFEREPSIYSRARAISTDEEVLRIWQRIGLAERLKQDMLSDKPIDFVDGAGRSFLSFAPQSRGNGHPPQLFIYQPALEQTLRDGVDRYPNVEVLLGQECVRVRQDAAGVELAVLNLADDTIGRFRAAYVIAADGGSSPTRGQLGVGFEGKTYEDRWVVIDTKVRKEWPTHDRLRFHCDPKRPAVDCPTPLGHHRWEFPVLEGEDEKELVSDESVWRLLEKQGIGPEHVEILRAVVYSHHVRFAARWQIDRIFLAGDAAHVMPPWIGQGMAAGVRDVGNLCWKIAGVVQGDLPTSVLESYEVERQPHVRKVTKKAVFFGRVITEHRQALTAVRNPAFRLTTRLPFAGAYFKDAKWFPATRYQRGFFQSRKGQRAAGDQIPQPWVLDEHRKRRRLDDFLASQWRLLHLGPAEPWGQWSNANAMSFEVKPAGSNPAPNAVVDVDGTLTRWMRRKRVTVIAVRPDGIVYAAAGPSVTLAAPPFVAAPAATQSRTA